MLSQTVEYALRAMVHVASAGPGASLGSEAIARGTKVPRGYLSKILRDLVVAELIRSQRGPNGGFTLARPAENLSMLDVINAVDPFTHVEQCPLGNPAHLQLCLLHRRMQEAVALIEREFARTTLAEMLETNLRAQAHCHSLLAVDTHQPGRSKARDSVASALSLSQDRISGVRKHIDSGGVSTTLEHRAN